MLLRFGSIFSMKRLNYKHTLRACFIAYMVQAIVCNFAPLLFVGWNNEFNIGFPQLTTIITLTFFTQMVVDLASAKFAEQIGYKRCLIISHLCSSLGFLLLGILPYIMKNAYAGIVISVMLYSVGSGLLEVLISPVVESCPTDNKAAVMSLLHSYYCWGTVVVIGFSTLYFVLFGRESWKYLSFIWAIFSILNGIYFLFVPVIEPKEEKKSKQEKTVFKNRFFYAAILLMICSGAAELAMSQWASTFAETGLNVSKAVGDLAGPMAFAVLMGAGRVLFSRMSTRVSIENYLAFSAVLCVASYLLACLSPSPVLSLIGCAVCGFSVSAMWPGTISLTTKITKSTSTVMFAFLALSGDIGCTIGPTAIGWITNALGADLKRGLVFSIIFPIIILVVLISIKNSRFTSKQ